MNRRLVGTLLFILLIAIGVFGLVAGEADDSPGLQGIGMIFILSAFFLLYKANRD